MSEEKQEKLMEELAMLAEDELVQLVYLWELAALIPQRLTEEEGGEGTWPEITPPPK